MSSFFVSRSYRSEHSFFNTLWQQCLDKAEVCDVTINLEGGQELRAHWCVLLICPYFKALFESGLREKHTSILDMKIVPSEVAKLAFQFMYQGRIQVKEGQCQDMIKIADFLQLDEIKSACANHLVDVSLSVDNCVTMCILGDMYNIDMLYEKSKDILQLNFEKVMKGKDILQVSADSLMGLMNDDNLKYIKAMDFFNLVVQWVDEDSDRKRDFPNLFASLDLKDFTEIGIEALNRCKYVVESAACRKLLKDHQRLISNGIFDPSVTEKEVLVFPGGQTNSFFGSRTPMCYAYVIEDDKWCQFVSLPRSLVGGAATLGTEAYICGKDGASPFTSTYKLLPGNVKSEWVQVRSEYPRHSTDEVYACTFSHDNKIITIRRLQVQIFLLMYDPASVVPYVETTRKNQRLLDLPNLGVSVSVKLCTLKEKIFIYINMARTGGRKNHFFVYNTDSGNLHDYSRGSHVGDILYLDGEKIYLETPGKRHSQVFDMNKSKWGTCRRGLPGLPNNTKLKNNMVTVHNNDLYIFGSTGNEFGSSPVCNLYKYCRKENMWNVMAAPPSGIGHVRPSCAIMKVPKDDVRCPLTCAHCRAKMKAHNYHDEYDDDDEYSDSFYADSDSWDGSIYESDIDVPFLLW